MLVVDGVPAAVLLGIIAELQQSCPGTQIQLADVVLSGAGESPPQRGYCRDSRVPLVLGDWLLDVKFIAVARHDHALFQRR
jgi:hypothetical protein